MKATLFSLVLVSSCFYSQAQSAGSLDPSFDPKEGPDGLIRALLVQEDGRLLVGGDFRSWGPAPANHLVRLNPDGSIDSSFQPKLGFSDWSGVTGLWPQPDGKVLISGGFDSVSGKPRKYFGRLLATGEDDPTFAGFVDGAVSDVAAAPDGTLYILGAFTAVNNVARPMVAHLLGNGQLDGSFNPSVALTASGKSVVVLPMGDVLCAGFNASLNDVNLVGLLRFGPDGQLDSSYNLGQPSFFAQDLQQHPSGSVFIRQSFGLNRLMPDGGLDQTFALAGGGGIWPNLMLVLPDGRLLLAGSNLTNPDGSRTQLLRVFSDGQADPFFHANVDASVSLATADAQGDIYIAGNFQTVDGVQRRSVARLHGADASRPPTLTFDADQVSLPSSSTTLPVCVIREGDRSSSLSATLTATPTSPAPSAAPVSMDFQFAQGEWRKVVTLPAPAANPAAPEQTVEVRLADPTGAVAGTNRALTVHLVQDQGVLRLRTGAISLAETAGVVLLQVQREQALAYPAAVEWKLSSADGNPETWFGKTSGRVAFAPGETNATISLRVLDNTLADGDRTVQCSLVGPSARMSFDGVTQCSIRLRDNDQPGYPGDGLDDSIQRILPTTDGKAFISGTFTSVHGTAQPRLARLNANGSCDQNFLPQIAFSSPYDTLTALTTTTEGELIIAGPFRAINGVAVTNLARLHTDGSLATTDAPASLPRPATSLAFGDNGCLLAVSDGTDFNGTRDGKSLGAIVKLLPDGRKDTNFATTTVLDYAYPATRLVALEQGAFLAAGGIIVYSNALPAGRTSPPFGSTNPVLARNLARFDASGRLDPIFNVQVGGRSSGPAVVDVSVSADGSLFIAGSFTNVNGVARLGLAHLSADGSLDPAFNPDVRAASPHYLAVAAIAPQTNGFVVAAIDDLAGPRLARFGPDGSLDAAFGVHLLNWRGSLAVAIVHADQVWVGGNFTSIDASPRYRFARFYPDGTLATDGALALAPNHLAPPLLTNWLLDSRLSGSVTLETSADLKTWTPVLTNSVLPGLNALPLPWGRAGSQFYRLVAH